ncbi:MAG: hypothetical protein ACREJX_16040, partial [Polyangiaceae bacterium]
MACGSTASPPPAKPAPLPEQSTTSEDLPLGAATWGELHSTTEELTVRVPDAKNWSIVKSTKPVFVAEHKKSRTALLATTFTDSNIVNRAMCEEKSRELGLVPKA